MIQQGIYFLNSEKIYQNEKNLDVHVCDINHLIILMKDQNFVYWVIDKEIPRLNTKKSDFFIQDEDLCIPLDIVPINLQDLIDAIYEAKFGCNITISYSLLSYKLNWHSLILITQSQFLKKSLRPAKRHFENDFHTTQFINHIIKAHPNEYWCAYKRCHKYSIRRFCDVHQRKISQTFTYLQNYLPFDITFLVYKYFIIMKLFLMNQKTLKNYLTKNM